LFSADKHSGYGFDMLYTLVDLYLAT
jgi:hypothetical protein